MTKATHGPAVLVVDDDPEELAATCRALGSRYPVLAAKSGEDALRVARAARPGAVVMDVMTAGGKDGFTTLRELHHDPVTRDVPVVFLASVGKATSLPFGSADLGGASEGVPPRSSKSRYRPMRCLASWPGHWRNGQTGLRRMWRRAHNRRYVPYREATPRP